MFASLGLLWSVVFPLLGAPDEAAHTVKAVAVARGDLSTSSTRVREILGVYPLTTVRIPRGYTDLDALSGCWVAVPASAARCARTHALAGRAGPTVKAQTYVGTYLPVYYAVVGLPSLVLGPDRACMPCASSAPWCAPHCWPRA